jgi:hypothetical protein
MAVHIVFESKRRTTDHWGVTPHAEGDAESHGSGGASPYLRRGPPSTYVPSWRLWVKTLGPDQSAILDIVPCDDEVNLHWIQRSVFDSKFGRSGDLYTDDLAAYTFKLNKIGLLLMTEPFQKPAPNDQRSEPVPRGADLSLEVGQRGSGPVPTKHWEPSAAPGTRAEGRRGKKQRG